MQLKYSFKKEWAQFFRTFRFWGVVIAIFAFALSNPIMFRFTGLVMDQVSGLDGAVISQQTPETGDTIGDLFGGVDIGEVLDMYSDAEKMYSVTLVDFASTGLLIVLLVLMSAAGGEQKKRAMIVPMCSGLQYKNYLLPKFVIYPAVIFAVSFVAGLAAGGACNALFPVNHVSGGMILLNSLLISVYMAFVVCVFISLGLCTSRPGVMAPIVFLGQLFIQSLLSGFGISDYHPFALLDYVGGSLVGVDISEKTAAIAVSVGLSVVIAVMMYFLALGVLGAKKINNQEEKAPEF